MPGLIMEDTRHIKLYCNVLSISCSAHMHEGERGREGVGWGGVGWGGEFALPVALHFSVMLVPPFYLPSADGSFLLGYQFGGQDFEIDK